MLENLKNIFNNNFLLYNHKKMKKLLLLVLSLTMFVLFVPTSQATDICTNDPLESADYNVEITSAVYLRTVSCMEESTIITTLSKGEVVHVIGKVEGWHKVERTDGTTGWIWETFVTDTNKPFYPTEPGEPEPDPMYDIGGHKYEEAIWYVYNNYIVHGYPDGSYQPDRKINRAELLKIIVEAMYNYEYQAFEGMGCFTDVPAGEWYAVYICFALSEGIVEGYPDGSFRPADEINFVEALKIIMIGFGTDYVEGDPWYRIIVDSASSGNYMPLDITSFDQKVTRAQIAEMITRILKTEESVTAIEDYLGDLIHLIITFESIEAGMNLEDYIGTGQCVYQDQVFENGESADLPDAVCTCTDGVLISCIDK